MKKSLTETRIFIRKWDGFCAQRGPWQQDMRARRQIKRAGLSRYTSLSDLHQKNDGRTCFGARGVVTSSRAGAPSRRGWGGFVPKEGPDSRICAQGAR